MQLFLISQYDLQYAIKRKDTTIYKVLQGTVLVTKNPCLYPGDIRKLQAIDVPVLKHCMRDCIVFPTVGSRPHSDEISGSDLDGDQYWVYWGNELKINKPVEPLSHSAAEKVTVPEVTNEMMIDYYLNAFNCNYYALIADVHTAVADQIRDGTMSPECIELATLFYRAIDSPKTGEIINMERVTMLQNEFCKSFPKFMMKFSHSYYSSSSILETLYLKAKSIVLSNKANYDRFNITPILKVPRTQPATTGDSEYDHQLLSLIKWVLRRFI